MKQAVKEKSNIKFKVYWNFEKNVPVILNEDINEKNYHNDIKYLSTDVRPVFMAEKYLINLISPIIFKDIFFKSVWANKSNSYYVNGVRINFSMIQEAAKIKDKTHFYELIAKFKSTEEMLNWEQANTKNFCEINKEHLNYLLHSEEKDEEGNPFGAEPFINHIAELYKDRILQVSFSGGKDSTAVSQLVRKSLNNQKILHTFLDTTLEFKSTYDYVKRFMLNNKTTPFFIEKNEESDFFEICKEIGPPSRIMSWCCSVFKTGPMGTTMSEINDNFLTFYGVRRSESLSRSQYKRVTNSPKIEKQIVASPIIDWLDIDVWLYILSEKIDFNLAYRQGFSRVGCWLCPNNSQNSDFLNSIINYEEHKKWNEFLINFAVKIGKPDAEVYINEGKWKSRMGGEGLDKNKDVKVVSKECTQEENSMSYDLIRPVNDVFFEFFKPFGKLNFNLGRKTLNEIFVLNTRGEAICKIIAEKGNKKVRVTLIGNRKGKQNKDVFFSKIQKQLRKFQTCINCQACNSACPAMALKVTKNKYAITSECTSCGKCIDHFRDGCLVANALQNRERGF